jgi:hypothetical protein
MQCVRRTASLAFVLALAAPPQLAVLAQDVDGRPGVTAQTGGDAQTGAPPADAPPPDAPPQVNRTGGANPPAGEAPSPDGPPVRVDRTGDKGVVDNTSASADAPPDADAESPQTAAGPPDPAAADAAGANAAAAVADANPHDQPLGVAAQLASWVTSTGDNGDRPFAVIDKLGARIFVFAPDGRVLGAAPVLVGLASGDDSVTGIGDKALSAISPDERTTPAGRFVARFGPAAGSKTVLWVDYADSISLHPVVTTNPKEHRLRRIKSASPQERRISYGCINVPASFYQKVVLTAFRHAGGIVYVLPDTRPVDEVFPAFAASPQAIAAADHAQQADADADPGSQPPPSAAADLPASDPPGAEGARDDPDGAVATQPAPRAGNHRRRASHTDSGQ